MQYWEAVGAMHRLEYLRRIQARNVLGNIGLHPGQPRDARVGGGQPETPGKGGVRAAEAG